MATKIEGKITGYAVKGTVPTLPQVVESVIGDTIFNSVTRKIKTPDNKFYVTVNFEEGVAKNVFISLCNLKIYEYLTGIAILMSKSGMNREVIECLTTIESTNSFFYKPTGFDKPKNLSVVSAIAHEVLGIMDAVTGKNVVSSGSVGTVQKIESLRKCEKCGNLSVKRLDGCDTCLECGDSKCG